MRENQPLSQQIFEELERRIGREHLLKRLQIENAAIKFFGGRLGRGFQKIFCWFYHRLLSFQLEKSKTGCFTQTDEHY